MSDCIFCQIISKEIPAEIIFENDKIIAFKDIYPASSIHILIVPKIHIKSINDIDKSNEQYIVAIHYATQIIAEKLGIKNNGYRLINNCGEGAGQTVFHLHYHLLAGTKLGPKII